MLLSVAWAVGVASISDWLGFGTEIGAFLAGVSLASTTYREAVGARLVSLRDFLLLFFFLDLGARLDFTDAGGQVLAAVVLSLFVLIGNPLIVIIIMGAMRYPVRVSFLAGLTVAQISEFSLILAALGLGLGHIDNSTVGLITIIGLVTISLSTYLILYSKQIYHRLAPVLSVFERQATRRLPDDGLLTHNVDVIIYGLGRYGGEIVDRLRGCDCAVLAVDFDPHATAEWNAAGIEAIFGDAEDLDLLESLPLEPARWVISTIPAADVNLALLHGIRNSRFRGRVALTAHNRHDVARLRASGADVVLEPFSIAARRVVDEGVHAKDQHDGPPAAD